MPGDSHSKIEAARAGDEVVIHPGTYKFRLYLSANGTAQNPIVIRAADPNNRPVWDLAGRNVNQWPGSYTGGDNDRAAWQISGSHYIISDIVIRNATNGRNSSALRFVDGDNNLVRNSLFQSNDNGLIGSGENNIIEFTEIDRNGRPGSSSMTHNVYLYDGSFIIRYSYIHDSTHGQNLHIRARDCTIENSWIARANNYEGDMMPGSSPTQTLTFRGNVIVQKQNPENNGQIYVLYNDTGDSGRRFTINFYYNTIIGNGGNAGLVTMRNSGLQFTSGVMTNNVVYRLRNIKTNDAGSNWSFSGTNNWFSTGANTAGLTTSIFGTDPGFQNPAVHDYMLRTGAAAIGAANPAAAPAPAKEYYKDETTSMRYRIRSSGNDLGAFESTTAGQIFGPYTNPNSGPPSPPSNLRVN